MGVFGFDFCLVIIFKLISTFIWKFIDYFQVNDLFLVIFIRVCVCCCFLCSFSKVVTSLHVGKNEYA